MESTESLGLAEAATLYLGTLTSQNNDGRMHRELFKFVHWCGPDRSISKLAPSEVGDYADRLVGTGTLPRAGERLQVVKSFLAYAKKTGLTDRNLAPHVRIRKSKTRSSAARAEDAAQGVEMTADSHAQLLVRLESLKAERGPIAIQIREAAADKDVRENAPLEAAREQLGHVEGRIRDIESTLRNAVVVDSSGRERMTTVKVGARVSVQEVASGREMTYTLADRFGADPLEGKISDASPLGKAMVGSSAGQEVEAVTPRGRMRYRILKVR